MGPDIYTGGGGVGSKKKNPKEKKRKPSSKEIQLRDATVLRPKEEVFLRNSLRNLRRNVPKGGTTAKNHLTIHRGIKKIVRPRN